MVPPLLLHTADKLLVSLAPVFPCLHSLSSLNGLLSQHNIKIYQFGAFLQWQCPWPMLVFSLRSFQKSIFSAHNYCLKGEGQEAFSCSCQPTATPYAHLTHSSLEYMYSTSHDWPHSSYKSKRYPSQSLPPSFHSASCSIFKYLATTFQDIPSFPLYCPPFYQTTDVLKLVFFPFTIY